MSGRWVVRGGSDEEIAIIESDPATRSGTVHMPSPYPVAMTPEMLDQFRAFLGLAAGDARGGIGGTDV